VIAWISCEREARTDGTIKQIKWLRMLVSFQRLRKKSSEKTGAFKALCSRAVPIALSEISVRSSRPPCTASLPFPKDSSPRRCRMAVRLFLIVYPTSTA